MAAEESDRFPAPTTDVVDAQRREAKLCSTRSSCLRKSSIWRSRSRRQRPEIKGRQVSDERWENRARRPKRGVICLVSAKYKRRHKTKRPTHSVFKLQQQLHIFSSSKNLVKKEEEEDRFKQHSIEWEAEIKVILRKHVGKGRKQGRRQRPPARPKSLRQKRQRRTVVLKQDSIVWRLKARPSKKNKAKDHLLHEVPVVIKQDCGEGRPGQRSPVVKERSVSWIPGYKSSIQRGSGAHYEAAGGRGQRHQGHHQGRCHPRLLSSKSNPKPDFLHPLETAIRFCGFEKELQSGHHGNRR